MGAASVAIEEVEHVEPSGQAAPPAERTLASARPGAKCDTGMVARISRLLSLIISGDTLNLDKTKSIFLEVLDLPPDVDLYSIRFAEVETWDSLAHMVLVGELEEQFDVMLDTDDVLNMSDLKMAVKILEKLGVDFTS
ncbi:MAG TPA: acyl carrier protein [Acidimicrobiales bacterium]